MLADSAPPSWLVVTLAAAPGLIAAFFAGWAKVTASKTNAQLQPPAPVGGAPARTVGELVAAGTRALENDVGPNVRAVAQSAGVELVVPPIQPAGAVMPIAPLAGADGNA